MFTPTHIQNSLSAEDKSRRDSAFQSCQRGYNDIIRVSARQVARSGGSLVSDTGVAGVYVEIRAITAQRPCAGHIPVDQKAYTLRHRFDRNRAYLGRDIMDAHLYRPLSHRNFNLASAKSAPTNLNYVIGLQEADGLYDVSVYDTVEEQDVDRHLTFKMIGNAVDHIVQMTWQPTSRGKTSTVAMRFAERFKSVAAFAKKRLCTFLATKKLRLRQEISQSSDVCSVGSVAEAKFFSPSTAPY